MFSIGFGFININYINDINIDSSNVNDINIDFINVINIHISNIGSTNRVINSSKWGNIATRMEFLRMLSVCPLPSPIS